MPPVRTDSPVRREAKLSRSHDLKSAIAATSDGLRRQWKSRFRRPFPEHLPHHLISGILAYDMQARIRGDLDGREKQYLSQLMKTAADALPARFGAEESGHQIGTVYVREYDGIRHCVTRAEDGFHWNGGSYKSLSAVALAITGTKWNGLRFFGLPAEAGRRGR